MKNLYEDIGGVGVKYALVLNRCPHGIEAISLDENDGGGIRLTDAKCCGRWAVIAEFPMSAAALQQAAEEFTNAADYMESAK